MKNSILSSRDGRPAERLDNGLSFEIVIARGRTESPGPRQEEARHVPGKQNFVIARPRSIP